MKLSTSLYLLASSLAPPVMAWGTEGHQIIASLAQIHLYPEVRSALNQILAAEYKGHLANVANWADWARNQDEWEYTAPMHFANAKGDKPAESCVFGEEGWMDEDVNVITAIHNMTGQIYTAVDPPAMDIPLRFLTHYIGDMHQPLHLCARLRGGNDAKVNFDGREKKLHGVWDGDIPKYILSQIKNFTEPTASEELEAALPPSDSSAGRVNPYVRYIAMEGIRDWWSGDIASWISCPERGHPFPHSAFSSSSGGGEILEDTWKLVKSRMPFQHFFGPSRPSQAAPQTPETLVCPYNWARDIHTLNCDIVWPKNFDEKKRPRFEVTRDEYLGRIEEERLIQRLFALAGLRLAKVINEAVGGEGYEGVYLGWQRSGATSSWDERKRALSSESGGV